MFLNYASIFEQRGHLYQQAMTKYPDARNQEFEHLIRLSDIKTGNSICDIPCGGFYLKRFINTDSKLIGVDACLNHFLHGNLQGNLLISSPTSTGLKSAEFDRVISLAGIHHMRDKKPFFTEVARLLKPGGNFCIADVAEGSPTSVFLDSIVNEHNSMGHSGCYLNEQTLAEVSSSGLTLTDSNKIDFFWVFNCRQDMVDFCSLLFGLDQINKTNFVEQTEALLSPTQASESYMLPWQLQFICGKKE